MLIGDYVIWCYDDSMFTPSKSRELTFAYACLKNSTLWQGLLIFQIKLK